MAPLRLDADLVKDIEHFALITYPRWWQRALRASFQRCAESLCMRAAAQARHEVESHLRAQQSVRRLVDALSGRQR